MGASSSHGVYRGGAPILLPMHPHGLQFLTHYPNAIAVGTLTTENSIKLDTGMVDIGVPFLLKRIRAYGQVSNMAGEEALIIGFARGSISTSEINSAFTELQISPEDVSNLPIGARKSAIFWQAMDIVNGDSAGNGKDWIKIDARIGARGKGIPLHEHDGIVPFVQNVTGSTMTTGALVDLFIVYEGVWMP